MGTSVEAEEIHKSYGTLSVLEGVTLRCQPGERLVILGESGVGKTTLLNIIAGLENPDAGRVYIGGVDVTQRDSQQRDLGFVFQSTAALWDNKTVEQHLELPLDWEGYPGDSRSEKIERILSLIRLEEKRHSRVGQLSGGQRQRVGLGRALVTDPPNILMDEPFSDLDRPLRLSLRRDVIQLQERLNFGMIFVTHDSQEAFEIADRVMVLRHGRIVQRGAPSNVVQNPVSEPVARFFGYQNILRMKEKASENREPKIPGLVPPENDSGHSSTSEPPVAILPSSALSLAPSSTEETGITPSGEIAVKVKVKGSHTQPGGRGMVSVQITGTDELIHVEVSEPPSCLDENRATLYIDTDDVIWIYD